MAKPLSVLIVEDNPKDAELLLRELKRGKYDVTYERVDTAEAMQKALESRRWDLVISDFSMPMFSVQGALDTLKQNNIDLPFIVVSGTVGEEVAIEAMRAGAHDFMPKGQFTRLLPAIDRELREAAMRAEHRAVEERLRHAQKIESLGQLTGGIAHDFNNLLAVIVGNIDLLAETLNGDPEKRSLANAALKSALHGAELTKRLLAVARQQPLSVRIVNINDLLPEIVNMLRRTLGQEIVIQVMPAKDLWLAKVDPTQVEDALLNLTINARDAMPRGGTISIDTMNKRLDEHYAALHPEVAPGDYVMLSVTDTGCGMPHDIVERAAEPFFTTKPSGKGTGLGLSMVHGFAKQSGGHLSIYSEVGIGTTIRLYLPAVSSPNATTIDQKDRNALSSRGRETVMVVDDNLALRAVVVRSLNRNGYKTLEADNGPTVLRMIDAGETFDLLFTDIGLPDGLDGFELAVAAKAKLPPLKVLFTTGYAKPAGNGGETPARFLHKPYRVEELLETVRSVLDAPPEG